jgi:2-keto-4-pentenoate hydratase/2-oxohepta-3-ene-1,7-dioic acid hydratase in catechol pathway
MRYTTVNLGGQHTPALEYAGKLYDLRPYLDDTPTQLLQRGHALWDELQTAWAAIERQGRAPLDASVQVAPPVPVPGKIVCIGLNYRKHAVESGMAIPEEPIVFSKYGNTVAASGEAVRIGGLEKVDYEAELAFVMGEKASNVREGDALSTVLGYTNANDISERALQMRSGQWLIGKTLDGFLPMGPSLVPAEAVGDPSNLPVRGWLNGELRQDSNTSDLIFSVQEIIAYVSRFMTLEPGDVVCTGTPEGVVLGMDPQVWVKPGDTYTVEIADFGRLTTPFTD